MVNDIAVHYIHALYAWPQFSEEIILYGSLIGGMLLIWYALTYLNNRRKSSVRGTMHQKREKYINDRLGGYLTEAVELAVFKNEITREEARMIYRRCANILNNRDFLPRNSGSLTLKEILHNRHVTQARLKAELAKKHGGNPKLLKKKADLPDRKITNGESYRKILFPSKA